MDTDSSLIKRTYRDTFFTRNEAGESMCSSIIMSVPLHKSRLPLSAEAYSNSSSASLQDATSD